MKPAEAPWPLEEGATLLDDVYAFVGRFVSYPSDNHRRAHVLWIAHSHFMDSWESTPRLAFLSPEPASGKTRALEITELMVPRPIQAVNTTSAYLFRKIGDPDGKPTILFDEIDTIFGPKAKENEDLRGVLNAGHRKGAVAGRCVVHGKRIETEELDAYCAVAVAGLGSLPDTLLSRAVIVRMRRRAPGESVDPYRRRFHSEEGHILRASLAAWAADNQEAAANTIPDMPQGIEDRDADVWESLLAVADLAGGEWPKHAHVAAVALVADSKESTPSLGIRLLADLKTLFGDGEALKLSMTTADILTGLIAMDEAPWGDMRGKAIDSRGLAKFLKTYGVKSTNLVIKVADRDTRPKGYTRADLQDAWQRYLPKEQPWHLGQSPIESATAATSATEGDTTEQDDPDLFLA